MITVMHETCWTHEAIAEIEMALDVGPRIVESLSDDDLSHVPTFGILVDVIAERT